MLLCLLRALAEFSLLSLFAKLTPFSRKPCFPFRAIGGENAVFTIIYDLWRNFRAWRACVFVSCALPFALPARGFARSRFPARWLCLFVGKNRQSLFSALISRAPGNVSGVEGRAVRPFTPECPSPWGLGAVCVRLLLPCAPYSAVGGLSSAKSVPCVCATLR